MLNAMRKGMRLGSKTLSKASSFIGPIGPQYGPRAPVGVYANSGGGVPKGTRINTQSRRRVSPAMARPAAMMNKLSPGKNASASVPASGAIQRIATPTPSNMGPSTSLAVSSQPNVSPVSPANVSLDLSPMFMAAGVLAGAGSSYITGGSILQGGIGGLALGAGVGYGGKRAFDYAAPKIDRNSSYSAGITKISNFMDTQDGRAATFAAGGLLGGFAFGGNRSHKRGFNSNRGNSIGR